MFDSIIKTLIILAVDNWINIYNLEFQNSIKTPTRFTHIEIDWNQQTINIKLYHSSTLSIKELDFTTLKIHHMMEEYRTIMLSSQYPKILKRFDI